MSQNSETNVGTKKRYVRAIGPRLRILLWGVFILVAILGANSFYLGAVTFLEWVNAPKIYQNYFYQLMFLGHLVLGLLLILPYLVFGIIHMRNARGRPNRRAVWVGYALFVMGCIVLVSGLGLTRMDIFQFRDVGLKDPFWRNISYWIHVLAPLLAVWLYVLHRLAGVKIRWKIGMRVGVATVVATVLMVLFHSIHPPLSEKRSVEGEAYFEPSAARTASGNFIPEEALMMDDYCLKCHPDAYEGWFHSAHHFSSFNNPFYLFSVRETREMGLKRDGNVKASRWCAGCHDPVPFFSGQFDDPNYDIHNHPTAKAGITCTVCHSISSVDSTIGNADYTIIEPIHYPFAYSSNSFLQYLNQQLVKAKPEFHKRMFLKDFMKSEEFCSTCHKVSIPFEVNHYKEWLRGQNHYDPFILSGAGHGARSFYYPPHASENCASCHMPLVKSTDFGARNFTKTNTQERFIHDHFFPAANTALGHILEKPEVVQKQMEFGEGSLRVDIFGIREGGKVDGQLRAPLRPELPILKPGTEVLIEIVIRTLKVGHLFPQGTADSNEIWLEVEAESGGRTLGRRGHRGEYEQVDPWTHFANVYMLDKDGNRIDRRNPQDIFTPLYNNQIPPGAGYVVHYRLEIPEEIREPIRVRAKLNYRKFDTIYYNYVFGKNYTNGSPFQVVNDLPIRVMASDVVEFPVDDFTEVSNPPQAIPGWQRWNDYGIGLFTRTSSGMTKGELISSLEAFEEVERLGKVDGALNQTRVLMVEGRLEEAIQTLNRAASFDPPAPQWTLAWLSGMLNKQNGKVDEAMAQFQSILSDRSADRVSRGFDFSRDYLVNNELALTQFEKAKQLRTTSDEGRFWLKESVKTFLNTLEQDSENLAAHYNLGILYGMLDEPEKSEHHRRLHLKYKPDDNARDRAVNLARERDPAANHASQTLVIYDLHQTWPEGELKKAEVPNP